eukprot:554047-Pelagomonas_calceolata.AAC.4
MSMGESTKRRIESVIRSNAPPGSAPGQYVGGYAGGMAGTFGKAPRGLDSFGNPSAPPRFVCKLESMRWGIASMDGASHNFSNSELRVCSTVHELARTSLCCFRPSSAGRVRPGSGIGGGALNANPQGFGNRPSGSGRFNEAPEPYRPSSTGAAMGRREHIRAASGGAKSAWDTVKRDLPKAPPHALTSGELRHTLQMNRGCPVLSSRANKDCIKG